VSEFCGELNSGHLIIKFEDNSLVLIILVQLGNVLNTLTSFVCRLFLTWHGVEAIAGLIPPNLYLKKLAEKSNIRISTLPKQHILKSLLSRCHPQGATPHPLSLASLSEAKRRNLISPIAHSNISLNSSKECFDPLQ